VTPFVFRFSSIRARPAVGHMPFFDHRTVAEADEDAARNEILRSLGRDRKSSR
jgi:hypothetical protein